MTVAAASSRGVALLRCDAGARHGIGHLSRSMTLAFALRDLGLAPRMVLHAPEDLLERVRVAGLPVTAVDTDVGEDVPVEWNGAEGPARVVVIDSKLATVQYVNRCRAGGLIACFDDETARDLPCDVLINNNVWATRDDYTEAGGRSLLLGPEFNTVNPGYFGLADRERNGILITLGGEDPNNHTEWLVRALTEDLSDQPVHVCVGPAHPDPAAVLRACANLGPGATVHHAPPSLLALAASCHLAISAGGTTCYELAAAGVATAVLVSEEHQRRLAGSMVAAQAAMLLGSHDSLRVDAVRSAFAALRHPAVSGALAAAGRRLFPAPGVERLAREIATGAARYN